VAKRYAKNPFLFEILVNFGMVQFWVAASSAPPEPAEGLGMAHFV
jgi:hypothetical protein